MKKLLLYVLSFAIVICAAVAGTIAYLTSEDSDVNVMTLGNVKIEQIEQEWNEDELVGFQQGKPLYPYVGDFGYKTNEADAYRQLTMNNVVDKYVSVKNTGKSDAYVRTVFAFEMGTITEAEFDKVKVSINAENGDQFKGTWNWLDGYVIEIDGHNYYIMTAIHADPLKPGETTIPSLLQVYLDESATNEYCAALDGNGNGVYDILVKSQAIQTAGFEQNPQSRSTFNAVTAKAALDAGFGPSVVSNAVEVAEWFMEEVKANHVYVSTAEELQAAIKALNDAYDKEVGVNANAHITLLSDIVFDASSKFMFTEKLNGCHVYLYHANVTLDLNGYNITAKSDALMPGKTEATGLFIVRYSEFNIIGEGNIVTQNKAINIYNWANATVNIYGGNYISNAHERKESAIYVNNTSSKTNVYGGTFVNTEFAFNNHNTSCTGPVIVLHEGVKFYDYQNHFRDDYNKGRTVLAEGCELLEEEVNGKTLYTIVKSN